MHMSALPPPTRASAGRARRAPPPGASHDSADSDAHSSADGAARCPDESDVAHAMLLLQGPVGAPPALAPPAALLAAALAPPPTEPPAAADLQLETPLCIAPACESKPERQGSLYRPSCGSCRYKDNRAVPWATSWVGRSQAYGALRAVCATRSTRN